MTAQAEIETLLNGNKPLSGDSTHGILVTFYMGESNSSPFEYAFLLPIKWENRMKTLKRHETILKSDGKDILGSVLLGVNKSDVPSGRNGAKQMIERMIPNETPLLMLEAAKSQCRVH